MKTIQRVAFVGVGAVGLLYASRLARAGVETHLLFRSDFDVAQADGIRVKSCDGDFTLPSGAFHAHKDASTVPAVDLVVVTAKTTANEALPGLLKLLIQPGTRLLTLQNGLGNEEFLADLFPRSPIFGGTAFVCVHRTAPAAINHQHGGRLHIGRHGASEVDADTRLIWSLLARSGLEVKVFDVLARARWEKQLWNVPFNGLGAALLADTSILLATKDGELLVRALMDEVMRVANADGHPLPSDLPQKLIESTRKMGAYRSSMQLDREAGRPLEIDAIVSSVRKRAHLHGLTTPLLPILELQLRSIDKTTKAPR